MKTAISIPNDIFDAAESLARRLNLSRSELYARAVADYLRRQQADDVRTRLDAVYAEQESQLDPVLAAMQRASLGREEW